MRRLLFLIADTGGGHRASAVAVARAVERRFPGAFAVTLADPFSDASPAVGGGAAVYGPLTRHGRWLWGAMWHATNSTAAVTALNATALRLVDGALRRRIERLGPDAVVSFHPLLNHAMVRAVRRTRRYTPALTVVTDLVDVHASWLCPGVDAVVVASAPGFDQCRRAGLPPARCHFLGLPVDARFTTPAPDGAGKAALRAGLGLAADRFTVLVCGGADGSGGLVRAARALATARIEGLQVAVITGRNWRARNRLRGLRTVDGTPVHVEGFVTNMQDWLRVSDVVATKAGPGTIAEALCCGVPLLLISYLPGQERSNVAWVTASGAGRFVPRTGQLVDAVAELAAPDAPALGRMREAACRVARRDAADRIADLIVHTSGGVPP